MRHLDGSRTARQLRGANAYHAGRHAEAAVTRVYERRGCGVAEHRWTGQGGEIDLIVRDGPATVFVEVKRGRDLGSAATHLRPRQMARIAAAAGEYLDTLPDGSLSEARFDVALVDEYGGVAIVENAFGCA
ncbi:hypothetical protein ATO11_06200 [Pseudaestuariivita atlantica]|uniref:UPF0102 protein ATO11_06200 n=2 Tax=Pseudaestuariivita atlantica TaxID=1317121 RepID=A0A0L1JTH5_9RHOB|nr:hypothetical protein ATO11_06200 [Pseudaestuariivita atlantica]